MKRSQRSRRSKPETVTVGNIKVSIYKRTRPTAIGKERSVFEVADYTAGTRRLRSFTDHAEARREAERIARQLSTGDATAAQMLNSDAASYGRALELLRPTGATLEMASATFAKCFEILGSDAMIDAAKFYRRHRADQITRKRVADVAAELVASREALGKSFRYLKDLRLRLAKFSETFQVDISTVTTPDVQRWLDRLPVGPQSSKNYRTVLGTLFSFAESRGYVMAGSNPVAKVERVKSNGSKIEIFTPDEISRLLAASSPEFLPVVAIGAFAGLRAAETERLDWRDVDLAGNFIHVSAEQSKTGSRQLVPIVANLAAWLAPYAKRTGQVFNPKPLDLQAARTACVEASGVAWKPNALRHSFASYRLAETQNAAQVALEMGNSPAVVFKHYRELVKPSAAKAWFAIAPEQAENVVSIGKVANG